MHFLLDLHHREPSCIPFKRIYCSIIVMYRREFIQNHETGRAFMFSTNGTDNGRPEFLFLDVPCELNLHAACLRIIRYYEETLTVPTNLEVITMRPFESDDSEDDLEVTFVARV
jgi:hypothetical protein